MSDSSAHAILERINDSASVLEAFCTAVNISLQPALNRLMTSMIERKVHTKRARKLRKRGERVWYIGRTSTGKAIYGWIKDDLRISFPL